MARSVADIEQEMITEKANHTELDDFSTASSVSAIRKVINVVAQAIHSLEELWDKFKSDVSKMAEQQKVGTDPYYKGKALAFNGGGLVTRVSLRGRKGTVLLKVAKDGANDTIINLTAQELSDLKEYFEADNMVIGTDLVIVSQTADLCSFKISVRYVGIKTDVEQAVIAALKSYLNTLFDTPLSKTLLEQELLKVVGVEDVFISELKVDKGLGYDLITDNSVDADAGYFVVGQDGSNNDLITLTMYT